MPDNDQVRRARGPIGLTFEQARSVSEGEDVEKPNDERKSVECLVMPHFGVTYRRPSLVAR